MTPKCHKFTHTHSTQQMNGKAVYCCCDDGEENERQMSPRRNADENERECDFRIVNKNRVQDVHHMAVWPPSFECILYLNRNMPPAPERSGDSFSFSSFFSFVCATDQKKCHLSDATVDSIYRKCDKKRKKWSIVSFSFWCRSVDTKSSRIHSQQAVIWPSPIDRHQYFHRTNTHTHTLSLNGIR